ncbi:hypothetical protein IQ07DRAFT_426110 [Pyrenochaeta sp. DS3sAY3a]|nr:hypothetical protein IQ07DRAFT_426110 [Pyrenochaeta sp. DS3sAY3a]
MRHGELAWDTVDFRNGAALRREIRSSRGLASLRQWRPPRITSTYLAIISTTLAIGFEEWEAAPDHLNLVEMRVLGCISSQSWSRHRSCYILRSPRLVWWDIAAFVRLDAGQGGLASFRATSPAWPIMALHVISDPGLTPWTIVFESFF